MEEGKSRGEAECIKRQRPQGWWGHAENEISRLRIRNSRAYGGLGIGSGQAIGVEIETGGTTVRGGLPSR